MTRAGFVTLLATAVAVSVGSPAARRSVEAAASTIEIKVSRRGFFPARVTARRGELTRFAVVSGDGEHCFALDAFRVEKRVRPGTPARFDLTPDKAGVFPFHCCLETGEAAGRERGELTVSD